ncbi:hypothetical protein [Anditalea andensis]|uniref:Uncharacterized protein n=1 Tax=Anditalea andensis TaxID=1048983 RepID=A0A074KV48_9BACT|nr:hypothetical protein [Anditalea andensis]KEO73861.1 hypothetical protein EL17_10185 [Anditalea andensis]
MHYPYLIVLLCSIIGISFAIYYYKSRSRIEVKEDDPEDHIKGMYFLKMPYEKIIIGFFGISSLVYLGMLIVNFNIRWLDLSMLILALTIALLLVYKIGMAFSEAGKFKWGTLIFFILSVIIAYSIYAQIPDFTQVLKDAREYTLTLHLLGMVLGLGGTTIIDFMIFHFMRNYKISSQEAVVMHLISQIIIIGLIFLIISGVAIFLTDIDGYLASDRFLMKMTVLLVVTINGAVLNLYIAPYMEKISLRAPDLKKDNVFKKISFAVGAISMVSWYSAFFLAMIKDLSYFRYTTLLIAYLILLGLSIAVSQFFKFSMEKEVKEKL